MVIALWLLGCAAPPLPIGSWEASLTCATEVDGFPACAGVSRALFSVDADDPPRGDHLTLFPGVARDDGSYSGAVGPLTGTWEGGLLTVDLVADLDDAFLSDGDADRWRDHALRLWGTPSSRCWDAAWAFRSVDGVVEVEGTAVVRRTDRTCGP